VVEVGRSRGIWWGRALARALFLLIGGCHCLIAVVIGVSLLASIFIDGEAPGGSFGLVLLDLVLAGPGVLALISALQAWDPPDDRWNGIRWYVLALVGSGLTLCTWAVVAMLLWAV